MNLNSRQSEYSKVYNRWKKARLRAGLSSDLLTFVSLVNRFMMESMISTRDASVWILSANIVVDRESGPEPSIMMESLW